MDAQPGLMGRLGVSGVVLCKGLPTVRLDICAGWASWTLSLTNRFGVGDVVRRQQS